MENLELCRSIDELRRIAIPIEIRKRIGIEEFNENRGRER